MNPKEFRIGNLVKYDGRITKITDVMCDSLNVINCDHSILYEMIEPVEITEDVLRGMGFYSDGLYWKRGAITFNPMDNGVAVDFRWLPLEFSHAHQLQNLIFALTGEEVTFNSKLL